MVRLVDKEEDQDQSQVSTILLFCCQNVIPYKYGQVQQWLDRCLLATGYGWPLNEKGLVPVTMEMTAAPESALELISCKCITVAAEKWVLNVRHYELLQRPDVLQQSGHGSL